MDVAEVNPAPRCGAWGLEIDTGSWSSANEVRDKTPPARYLANEYMWSSNCSAPSVVYFGGTVRSRKFILQVPKQARPREKAVWASSSLGNSSSADWISSAFLHTALVMKDSAPRGEPSMLMPPPPPFGGGVRSSANGIVE